MVVRKVTKIFFDGNVNVIMILGNKADAVDENGIVQRTIIF